MCFQTSGIGFKYTMVLRTFAALAVGHEDDKFGPKLLLRLPIVIRLKFFLDQHFDSCRYCKNELLEVP